jgi:hypothetical protein
MIFSRSVRQGTHALFPRRSVTGALPAYFWRASAEAERSRCSPHATRRRGCTREGCALCYLLVMGPCCCSGGCPSGHGECRRRRTASGALQLPAAPDAQRSALYTSHKGACNQTHMSDRSYEEHLEADVINQALRVAPIPLHQRCV